MNSLEKECQRQKVLQTSFLEEHDLRLLEDPHNLNDKVGTVQKVKVKLDSFTPKGLYKFYIEGEPNLKAFHLVSSKHFREMDLQVGNTYELEFVIGVRRVGEIGHVISLRLPQ